MQEETQQEKRNHIFNLLKQILGVVALIVGLAGIVFPILPGWILIFIGLELLGIKIVFVDNIKKYVLEKIEKQKGGKKK